MPPCPVCLTILFLELGEILIFTMLFLYPNAIGTVFVSVPVMIIVVRCVVIRPVILGTQRGYGGH